MTRRSLEDFWKRGLGNCIKVNEIQFGFMPRKGTVDEIFIVRRLQEEYRDNEKKLYIYFVVFENEFYRFSRRMIELALRRKDFCQSCDESV